MKLTPQHLAELVRLVDDGILSKQSAKEVFLTAFQTGEMPSKIVKEKGLELSVDTNELRTLCEEVIAAFPKPVAEYRAGKEKALNVLKGQLMKRTQGKVPVSAIEKTLTECLKG